MPKLSEASATVARCDDFNIPKKVIAVCLLVLLTVQVETVSAVDADCDFSQELVPGVTYSIYNPNYPQYSVGRRACRWRATSTNTIRLSCQAELRRSFRCWAASIMVDLGNNVVDTYCGSQSFTEESTSGEMTINFNEQYWVSSRFACSLQAIVPPNNCRCGWKNPTRIVGGQETGVNEYPMMAGIVDTTIRDIYCGGTIISNKHVLTAAHCLVSYNQTTTGVVVGEHDVTTGNDTTATRVFRIDQWIIHPRYTNTNSEETFSYDLAIIVVRGTIQFNSKVGPACLPFRHSVDFFTNEPVTLLGWGTVEFAGPKSDTLQKVEVRVTSQEDCKNVYPTSTNQELCTFAPGKDSCQFDSGGPVLWLDRATRNLVLVGTITAGKACASNDPAINQRVGAHINWIYDVTTRQGVQYCQVE